MPYADAKGQVYYPLAPQLMKQRLHKQKEGEEDESVEKDKGDTEKMKNSRKKELTLELKPISSEFIPALARPTPSLNNLAKEFVPSSVEFIPYDPNPSKTSHKQKYSGNRSKPQRDRPNRPGGNAGGYGGSSSASGGGGYRGRQKQKQWVPKAKGKKLNHSGPSSDEKWGGSEGSDTKNPVAVSTGTNGQTHLKPDTPKTESHVTEIPETTDS